MFIDREYADIANFIVFSRLEQGIVHAADIPKCREYDPDTTEKVEISEGVMLLSKAMFEKVYKDGWADVGCGIYTLFGILNFWDREYFEYWPTQKNLWIESKCEFEREYRCTCPSNAASLVRDAVERWEELARTLSSRVAPKGR